MGRRVRRSRSVGPSQISSSSGGSETRPSSGYATGHEYEVPADSRRSRRERSRDAKTSEPRRKPRHRKRRPRSLEMTQEINVYEVPNNNRRKSLPISSQKGSVSKRSGVSTFIGDNMLVIKKVDGYQTCQIKCLNAVERSVQKYLWRLGLSIHGRPYVYVAMPLVLLLLATACFIIRRSALDFDNGLAWLQKANPPSFGSYKANRPEFNAVDRSSEFDLGFLFSSNGADVLLPEKMEEYLQIKHKIEDLMVDKGGIFWYKTLCRFDGDFCEYDPIYFLNNFVNRKLMWPSAFDVGSNNSVYLPGAVGGVDVNLAGEILSAKSIHTSFRLKTNRTSTDWIAKFQSLIPTLKEQTGANVHFWSLTSILEEYASNLARGYHYVAAGMAAILLSVPLVVCVATYQSLAVGASVGVAAVGSAILALGVLTGVTGELFPAVYPGLICIAGSCIFFSSLQLNDEDFIPHYSSTTAFLTLSSVATLVGAVVASVAVTLPGVRYACQLAAVGSIAVVILSGIFVPAAVSWAGRSKDYAWIWIKERLSRHDKIRPTANQTTKHDRSFAAAAAETINTPCCQCFAGVLLCVYVLVSVWGLTRVHVSLTEQDLMAKNSDHLAYVETYGRDFGYLPNYIEVEFGKMDYLQPHVRSSLSTLVRQLQSTSSVKRVVSWFSAAYEQQRNIGTFSDPRYAFASFLVNGFMPKHPRFEYDVSLAHDRSEVVASRIYVELQNADSSPFAAVSLIEKTCTKANLPFRMHSSKTFLPNHDIFVPTDISIALFSVLLGTFCVYFLSTGCFLDCSGYLFAMLTLTMGSVGIASFWSVSLNVFTVSAVMSAFAATSGLVLQFCHEFGVSPGIDAKEKCIGSIKTVFWPVTISGSFTIVGILITAGAECQNAMDMVKVVVTFVGLGIAHVFIFLPLLLRALHSKFGKRGNCFDAMKCCSAEDDVSSIFFIPTTPKTPTDAPTFPTSAREITSPGSQFARSGYAATISGPPANSPLYLHGKPDVIPVHASNTMRPAIASPEPPIHAQSYSPTMSPVSSECPASYCVQEPDDDIDDVIVTPLAADLRNRQSYADYVEQQNAAAHEQDFYMYPAQAAWERSLRRVPDMPNLGSEMHPADYAHLVGPQMYYTMYQPQRQPFYSGW